MKGQGVVEYSLVLFGLAVVALIFMALVGPAYQEAMSHVIEPAAFSIPGRMSDLPLTDHAMNKHWDEPFNASNLPGMWDGDQCIRKSISYCPKEEKIKAMCKVKPGEWGGIVVSLTNPEQPVIVTAFQGPEAYWMGNVKGCIPVVMP